MKKAIYLFLILAVIAVIAVSCSQKTTVTQAPPAGGTPGAVSAPSQAASQPAKASGAQPDLAALEKSGYDCLENTQEEVCRPVNYAIASVGDTVGFAFGFVNDFPVAKKISLTVKYLRTQQGVGDLPIETDKDIMQQWLAVNDFEPYYELQSHEKLSKPILVKIEDAIGGGKPTVPGAYVFEIQAKTYENGFYTNYGGAQQITVRVK